MRCCKLALLLFLAFPMFSPAQVVINEILAENANKNAYANEINEFGNASDWVELYNNGEDPINLKGYMLLKGPNSTNGWETNMSYTRFVFTNNDIELEPGFGNPNAAAYLRLWCDKDAQDTNYTIAARDIHTGFALDKNGDSLILVTSNDLKWFSIDSITFGLQLTDMSIGRDPVDHRFWSLCTPTPVPTNGPSPNLPNIPFTQFALPSELRINEWCPTNWSWWIEVINHPGDTNAGKCGNCHEDWIEVYNSSTNPIALSWQEYGYDAFPSLYLSINVPGMPVGTRPFTPLSFLEGNAYQRFWAIGAGKISYAADELDFKLSFNTGETITLTDSDGLTTLQSLTFPGLATIPWVTVNSIIAGKTNLTWYSQGFLPDGDPTNKVLFPVVLTNNNVTVNKSTPGDSNFLPLTNGVYINEVLAHTDPPLQDAVEFINVSSNNADISFYYFSNSKSNVKKYRIPANTIVPKGGYLVLYEYQFNSNFTDVFPSFNLNSAHGDSACLYSANSNGVLTGYRRIQDFDASISGVSFGRYTNSQGNVDFPLLNQLTLGTDITRYSDTNYTSSNTFVHGLGASNAYPLVGPIVITEIMYHPPDIISEGVTNDNSLDEYIEIYNMSTNTVALYDDELQEDAATNRWRISKTVDYKFSQDTNLNPGLRLPPGGFLLLVNFNPWEPTNFLQFAHFTNIYKIPGTFTNIYGPYSGKLGNSGGTIELIRPDYRQQPPHPDAGYVPRIIVEKVSYNDKAPWPTNADGGGFSLQRLIPQGYANDVTNWVASTPSPGRLPEVKFVSTSQTNNSITMTFYAWPFVTNYTVQRTSALSNNILSSTWTTVSSIPASTTFTTRQVTDVVPTNEIRFYRIRAQ
jgi:hypothetical protein